jgi:Na+-transporting methylmalonyl-CoA/oxaloacetate decarboxylase gamma subunit
METVAIDWTYTISTLAVRFVGVFVVLGILQVVMQISGRIFATMDAEDGQKAISKPAEASHAVTAEQAAAVGMALYLSAESQGSGGHGQ